MDDQIIAIYTLVSDFLITMGHKDDPQCKMSDAEVMTTSIVASLYFGGNFESARSLLRDPKYIPSMLSKSRLNRRVHKIKPKFLQFFSLIGRYWVDENEESMYAIDTFPIAVCDNYRIYRNKIYKGEEMYRGYTSSKKRYFYGLKLHLMVTKSGFPVEFFLTPGSESDVGCLELFDFDLPEGSEIYADKIYNDYVIEDVLEIAGLHFMPLRKKNSKRKRKPWETRWIHIHRKMIETTGSLLNKLFPKKIHAVTNVGFELKVCLFVLTLSIQSLIKVAT